MTRFYKIIRAVAVVLLVLSITVPTGLYILLSTSWAHNQMRDIARTQLSDLLGTRVEMGRVDFAPFNRIRINDLRVADDNDSICLRAADVAARFELSYFLRTGKIAVDYVALDSVQIRLYRKSAASPLNIAGILEKLSSKEPKKEPSKFNLAVNTILISDGTGSYNVLDVPATPGKFNISHIDVSNLQIAAQLPRLSNDIIDIELERFSAREHCGLILSNLTLNARYTSDSLNVHSLRIALPNTDLRFADMSVKYDDPSKILQALKTTPVSASILPASYFNPVDVSPLAPVLTKIDRRFYISADVKGNLARATLSDLRVEDKAAGLEVSITADVQNLSQTDSLRINDANVSVKAMPGALSWLPEITSSGNSGDMRRILSALGNIQVEVRGSGDTHFADATVAARTSAGNVDANIVANGSPEDFGFTAEIDADGVNLAAITGKGPVGRISATVDANGKYQAKKLIGAIDTKVSELEYLTNIIRNIEITAETDADRSFSGSMFLDDEIAGKIKADIEGSYAEASPRLALKGEVSNLSMSALGVKGKYESYRLTTDIDVDLSGRKAEWINGHACISNLNFSGAGPALRIKDFKVEADNTVTPNYIDIHSDFLNGRAEGSFVLAEIVPEARDIVGHIFPVFAGDDSHIHNHGNREQRHNDFHFELELANAENVSTFLNLPVHIVYPVSIDGMFDYPRHSLNLIVDAPYLQQGEKIIENTAAYIGVDGTTETADIYATSTIPTQKGVMAVATDMRAANNRVDTKINWVIERDKPINGDLSFSTEIGRHIRTGGYTADIDINPGDINFGNDVWKLTPARISIQPEMIAVNNFAMTATDQSIRINGMASDDNESELTVSLNDIELISIFETLDINNALIGGRATGTFHARELFGEKPQLWCDNLFVRNIGYNYCTLGDGNVQAVYNSEKQAFDLDADIIGPEGRKSHIFGSIFAVAQALDITFNADRVKVGFMKPFMSAFAADVTGYASGNARLFGTFKDIDLEGDLLADSLGLKLDFTNTWYYATDSVHIRPGIIDIDDVRLTDQFGNQATLNGYVKHTFFHYPEFEFRLTDARHLLCYDVNSRQSPDWYGRVFGNGSAFISGKPGVVNIDVNMTTTEGSIFTFVLNDTEVADEYTFITFRDRTPVTVTDTIIEVDRLPDAVREYRDRERARQAQVDAPSAYNMNIQVEITPAARVVLVMDPIGGDEIKSNGSGNLRLTYESIGNDLHMYGRYTIDRGSYNFTLQDIIVKDFNISEGSSITFTGDPYAARLDIKATYSVNANLSDLDETFLQDKDLNRTNVPVHAVLMASGDMRQPDISFDLEFPTLNSDIYRKVRSIVSTEEMMNRQIIYLLALNRFYTPEYMTTTKGNELFSVASSTIASQLSSMLGKLSENWSIAPNLRSDRGDFSDVEVDVALSSSLLNNRLLFNGNFGYRDKSLNTNQFIGDFDIEYLLNRKGTWRLKAYNRYNDQNYYLRTAQTTQGIGVMFKRDFDNLFNFLKPKHRPVTPITPDSSVIRPIEPNDSAVSPVNPPSNGNN